jgi:hypothetical protein
MKLMVVLPAPVDAKYQLRGARGPLSPVAFRMAPGQRGQVGHAGEILRDLPDAGSDERTTVD